MPLTDNFGRSIHDLRISITDRCNYRCVYCRTGTNGAAYAELPFEDYLRMARILVGLGITKIRLTGGEPLLRKDFFDILAKANTSSFKHIIIQTNGLLIKKLHKEINASPITDVAVSIDGLKETNDQIRGIRGYFDLGIEGIKLLQGKRVAISVTLNRISARELEQLDEVARQAGAHIETNILSRSLSFLSVALAGTGLHFQRDVISDPGQETDQRLLSADRARFAPESKCSYLHLAACN